MRFTGLHGSLLLSLLPFLIPAHAQDQNATSSYVAECVNALQSVGFTALADVITKINGTESGETLFSQLSNGQNYTLFAPNNEAIQKVPSSTSSNATLLAEILSYHFVAGEFKNVSLTNSSGGGATSTSMTTSSSSFPSSATMATLDTVALFEKLSGRKSSDNSDSNPQPISGVWPNVTIGRTLLNSSDLVTLEGNQSQVLVWTRSGSKGNITMLNQAYCSQNITVVNGSNWNNLFINGITGVLTPPQNLTIALTAVNATAAQAILSNFESRHSDIETPIFNITNGSIIDNLQSAEGITIFLPNNDAFSSVSQSLRGLANNQTALTDLVQNHYVNGSTIYSTTIANGSNVTSAAGEPLQFLRNMTGLFIFGTNGSSAQIVRPDVLLKNGVVHIIDQVLFTEDTDPSAASQAYSSAISVAATLRSATPTGPIGIVGGASTTTITPSSPPPASTTETITSSGSSSEPTSSFTPSSSTESTLTSSSSQFTVTVTGSATA